MRLHPICIECKKTRLAQVDEIIEDKVYYRKDDFVISCSGIPLDYNELLQDKLGKDTFAQLTKDELRTATELFDPIVWAKRYLSLDMGGWAPRGAREEVIKEYALSPFSEEYQSVMLRCSARRKISRCGRRIGKTVSLCVKAIHASVTTNKFRTLIIAPEQKQIDEYFKEFKKLIESSPEISNSIPRWVASPYHQLVFGNQSTIVGLTAGTKTGAKGSGVRGQGADLLIIDEMDYLSQEDLDAILAILADNENIQAWFSSTPSGFRGRFYELCFDPTYKEFYFPTMCKPDWSDRMELDLKKSLPGQGFIHEALAEFGEAEAGVFQNAYIDRAISDYTYLEQQKLPDWIYMLGVDWNPVNGTVIYVTGARVEDNQIKFRTVDLGAIATEGFTQQQAIKEIIRLSQKWGPEKIYVDDGAGAVQIELLRSFGGKAPPGTPDARLRDIIVPINFSKHLTLYDPWLLTEVDKPAKPAMVNNSVLIFENNQIEISKWDNTLIRELQLYMVKSISKSGVPTYGPRSADVKDHHLDAMMISLIAFTLEKTEFGRPVFNPICRSLDKQIYDLFKTPQPFFNRTQPQPAKRDLEQSLTGQKANLYNDKKPGEKPVFKPALSPFRRREPGSTGRANF